MSTLKVLIVDDELELVQTLVERLDLRGVAAEGVTTASEALDQLERSDFDVALIDVKMPGMSGLELVREVRRRRPGQAVVLLTGHGSAELADEGLRLGAFRYLMKPVQLDALITVLREAAAHAARGRS